MGPLKRSGSVARMAEWKQAGTEALAISDHTVSRGTSPGGAAQRRDAGFPEQHEPIGRAKALEADRL